MVAPKSSSIEASPDQQSLAFFQLLSGVFGILLVLATWPLWIPGEVFPEIPLLGRLPLLGSPSRWPDAADYLTLAAMISGFMAMILSPMSLSPFQYRLKHHHSWYAHVQTATFLFAIGFFCSVMFDQHRLQPWAIQFSILSLLFAGHDGRPRSSNQAVTATRLASASSRLQLARLLVLGIYFWSAVSKLDYQFAYTVGSEILMVPASWLGVDLQNVNRDFLAISALSMPLIELLAVVLLSFSKSRALGAILAISMHVGLLAILGPLGLEHYPGVLLWNLFSIFQVWLLFGKQFHGSAFTSPTFPSPTFPQPPAGESSQPASFPIYSAALILLMLVLPIGERWGYYDHWPSWALYAPHSSRVSLLVPAPAVQSLPESLRSIMPDQQADTLYVDVPLDRWSLESVAAPIYPQARYQLGVAIAVVENAGLERDARVILKGPADRWTGEREAEELNGLHQMKKAGERFWFNAVPASGRAE